MAAGSAAGPGVRATRIFELRTPRGWAYLQYTPPDYLLGEVMWVFPGLHTNRPAAWPAPGAEQGFNILFAMRMAAKQRLIEEVAHAPIVPTAPAPAAWRERGIVIRDGRQLDRHEIA